MEILNYNSIVMTDTSHLDKLRNTFTRVTHFMTCNLQNKSFKHFICYVCIRYVLYNNIIMMFVVIGNISN